MVPNLPVAEAINLWPSSHHLNSTPAEEEGDGEQHLENTEEAGPGKQVFAKEKLLQDGEAVAEPGIYHSMVHTQQDGSKLSLRYVAEGRAVSDSV